MPRGNSSKNEADLTDLPVGEQPAEDAPAKPAKAPKVKLTPEERRDAVRSKRTAVVANFFNDRSFEYVGPVDRGEDAANRYTDVTGNKGRKGHEIRDTKTGEVITVGPGTLEKGVETYKAITGYVKPVRTPKAEADSETPADAEAVSA